MQSESVGFKGVLARFVAALVLVYGTFNPEGFSFFHWAVAPLINGDAAGRLQLPSKVLLGLLLAAAWVFFVQTTRRAIGWKGALLILGILGAFVWALIDWQILKPGSSRVIGHIVLVALALVLTLGMSWSHISRRVSGQVDTDDIN